MPGFKNDFFETLIDVLDWLWSVAKHWRVLATGGTIMAVDWAVHAWRQTDMTKTEFVILAAVFVLIACFRSWRGQRESKDQTTRKRKTMLDQIGGYRAELKARYQEIKRDGPDVYFERTDCGKLRFDQTTKRLVEEIPIFISENLDANSREDFLDIQHMDRKQIDWQSESIFHARWQYALWLLAHYEHNLKIIGEKIDLNAS
jgi:hypothetical protein